MRNVNESSVQRMSSEWQAPFTQEIVSALMRATSPSSYEPFTDSTRHFDLSWNHAWNHGELKRFVIQASNWLPEPDTRLTHALTNTFIISSVNRSRTDFVSSHIISLVKGPIWYTDDWIHSKIVVSLIVKWTVTKCAWLITDNYLCNMSFWYQRFLI